MISEPYKIKEVKKFKFLKPYERWNIIKKEYFNTFHICSDYVSFDFVSRGMSSWSHFQKAGYMIGDEAYAGSQNYINLINAAKQVLGIERLVPTHNGIGTEKLLATTMIKKGQIVLNNKGKESELVLSVGGKNIDITNKEVSLFKTPEFFGANIDLLQLESLLKEYNSKGIAYIHIETCPQEWNCQTISLDNLIKTKKLSEKFNVPLVIDISNILETAYWINKVEQKNIPIIEITKKIIDIADIILMDGSQDCRADVGGFITSKHDEYFEKFRNQVVVFEGLHTYGGMTGRAMEVFSIGIKEMENTDYVKWYSSQVCYFYEELKKYNVPVYMGAKGIGLDVFKFLPHLKDEDYPKFVLAAALYIHGGIRGRLEGLWDHHINGNGKNLLMFELPRCAYTNDHLREIARLISEVYNNRNEITGLKLLNNPEYVDQAKFEPHNNRIFVSFSDGEKNHFELYKIAIFEPLNIFDKEFRINAIKQAGYNTFLLDSKDVYIDLLTDSGTSAMSCYQWEGMTNSSDTPYSSKHYIDLVNEFKEILGYNYIIPTHQGRAAEHIMSQVMIKPGQIVPGNMYFTTTKLHQEMAGGIFKDIIVDHAHDPTNNFPWKGNIDIDKLKKLIDEFGEKNISYISFEMSVNMAGGQPFSMDNVKEVSRICQKHGIPIMFDATRCIENSYMIKMKDKNYAHKTVKEILREMLSYGDGCTISCKKDFLVNMGGILACNSSELNKKFLKMLRIWEGDITNGGMDPKDIEALRRGLLDSLDDDYIRIRIEQTQKLGNKLLEANIPIVEPPGSHAIFLDAKRFLPHIDQNEYPAQALAAAIYIETGVRSMERGNVSKGRDPVTGQNYCPALELVRLTIPRRVYTNSHIDFVVNGIKELYQKREMISGLKFVYEPPVLRFFQGRFEPLKPWKF